MRTIRIYYPGDYQPGSQISLNSEVSHRLGTVLRLNVGDVITLFRGDNLEFPSTLVAVDKKTVTVQVDKMVVVDRESPLKIHLAQALSKADKMDWVMQKAVELGVTSIVPVITQHCAVKLKSESLEKKHQQWQKIIIAAAEQSGRTHIPLLLPYIAFKDYIQCSFEGIKLVLSPHHDSQWQENLKTNSCVNLIIGPEGGLADPEIQQLIEKQFKSLTLGPRILRTETATLVALALLQHKGGDF